MYKTLISFHSVFRWLVLGSLVLAISISFNGYRHRRPFGKWNNAIRHWTATIAHVQLMIGIVLYTQSPMTKYFWQQKGNTESWFFGLVHITLMLLAIICITLGSAFAKRKMDDQLKHATMLRWFAAALLIIFVAVPWPFSPFATRPFLR